jgi:CTP synthase
LDQILLRRLSLPETAARMDDWQDLIERIRNPKDEVTIHFVGKYVEYEDSYKSINEALFHGGFHNRVKVKLRYVEAEALEGPEGVGLLEDAVGILVAPGFGDRGSRGMMAAAEYARTKRIPYFGICYGFQWAVVEFARNVAGLDGADSTEVVENAEHKIIYKLRDLLGVDDMGGTMRLGSYACGCCRIPWPSGSMVMKSVHERTGTVTNSTASTREDPSLTAVADRRPVLGRQVRRDR